MSLAKNKPELIIVLLVAVFLVMLGIALYAPAYITSYSPGSSSGLTVTPLSYVHHTTTTQDSSSEAVLVANYTGLFYVQHVCTYHQ